MRSHSLGFEQCTTGTAHSLVRFFSGKLELAGLRGEQSLHTGLRILTGYRGMLGILWHDFMFTPRIRVLTHPQFKPHSQSHHIMPEPQVWVVTVTSSRTGLAIAHHALTQGHRVSFPPHGDIMRYLIRCTGHCDGEIAL